MVSSGQSAWVIQALSRVRWMRQEVKEAAVRKGLVLDDTRVKRGDGGVYALAYEDVLQRLADAETCLTGPSNPMEWLRGTRVEAAWTNIHAAHARLMEVAGPEQVSALVIDVRSAVASYLPRSHAWAKRLAAWQVTEAEGVPVLTDVDRELLSNALRQAYEANAEMYTRLRRFRNILVGTAVLFATMAVALSVLGALSPKTLPLCFEVPAATTGAEGEAAVRQSCPTGAQGPSGGDVALVGLLGLVGGAVGAMPSVTSSSRATVTTYTLRVSRMLLKIGLGPVAAIVGLLFLRAGVVPGFDVLDRQGEILGYAVVFGVSQQLITRIADRHAERVLKSASSETDDDKDNDEAAA